MADQCFIQSGAAQALRGDLIRHALEGSPCPADAVSMLMGAAGAILEISFPPSVAAQLMAEAVIEAGQLSTPQGRA